MERGLIDSLIGIAGDKETAETAGPALENGVFSAHGELETMSFKI